MDEDNSQPKGRAIGGRARAEKLSPEERAAIAKKGAVARWQKPRAINAHKTIALIPVAGQNPRSPEQGVLDLQVEKQIEIDGVGMGVLSDGTPFLTGRGLARLCGVDSSRVSEMSADWNKRPPNPMTSKIKEILRSRGVDISNPYIEIKQRSGFFYAYPDVVCLATLEYYAFDALNTREEAKKNYRLLAGKALHDFIYAQVGYDPNNFVPQVWRQFHDRVSLTYNSVPAGYFSVFKEIADMIVTLGQAGLHIDSTFVPDGSVGSIWARHWNDNTFDVRYGGRIEWEHNYPEYFPQAKANPQLAWCYPEAALPEFRRWMRENYIGDGKFTRYINNKIIQKQLPASFAQLVMTAYRLDQ